MIMVEPKEKPAQEPKEEPKMVDNITEPPEPMPEEAPKPKKGKAKAPASVSPELTKRMKFIIIVLFGVPYGIFIVWCLFLLMVLPDPTGAYNAFIPIGSLTSVIGIGVLGLIGLFGVSRIIIKREKVLPVQLAIGAGKVLAAIAPGIVLGIAVPMLITAEPKLSIQVTEPTNLSELVAPIAVTFSMEDAAEILGRRGVSTVSFGWDFDGDGTKNEDTVLPTATAVYPRLGAYNVIVDIQASDGRRRRVVRRLLIQKQVFEVTPIQPIVDEPVKFSVAHLVDTPEEIEEIQWDFENDGVVDEVTTDTEIVYTFSRVESTTVSALVQMQNQTQFKYQREIQINEKTPLPFDIAIASEPKILVSPPPFQTLFTLDTQEPIRSVKWDFGDGEVLEGERVGHTFFKKGNFMVMAQVKSEDGENVKLTQLVRVVNELKIPDLSFSGTPEVDLKNDTISGEVPVQINITPTSSLPLVDYSWEVSEATSVGSTETTLEAIYRRPGTYSVTMIAMDAAGHALRMPLTVEVLPPERRVVINMDPKGGAAPLTVNFDASETRIPDEEISGFEWLFGDQEKESPRQGGAVMSHTYKKPGTYTVKVSARTTEGNVYDETSSIVVRTPLIDACFRASRTTGEAPLGVQFNMDCSTGEITEITWDFGDGATTDERDPIHVFEEPGTYTVNLTIRDINDTVSSNTLEIIVE